MFRRFSGSITDYLKRYAGLSLPLRRSDDESDWTFSARDYRASGTNPLGIIAVEGSPESSGYFRIQAGFPGDFREILLRWVPKTRGRKNPVDQELARKELQTLIRWLGDFGIEEPVEWTDGKLIRLPAVLGEGRWVDQTKARLGSGPFRFYVMNDPGKDRDLFIYMSVQGRGVGPEASETPAPQKEEELMQSLIELVESLRL